MIINDKQKHQILALKKLKPFFPWKTTKTINDMKIVGVKFSFIQLIVAALLRCVNAPAVQSYWYWKP